MPQPDTASSLPFTILNRTLAHKSVVTNDLLTTITLEEVRDYLKHLFEVQQPTDHDRTLDQLHVDLSAPPMTAFWLQSRDSLQDLSERRYLFTSVGASQLASEVLPSRFFAGLKELKFMDTTGARLATMVWSKFASGRSEIPRKVRTIRVKLSSGEIRWVIRSVHSLDYAPYSNLQFVQDILDNAEAYAKLPILQWWVTDNAMRIRFVGFDPALAAFANMAPELLMAEPVPMIEAWNSETGCRRTGLRGGMFSFRTMTGLGHWNENMEYNWIHRGSAERIRGGVKDAFQNLFTIAGGVVQAYKTATDIAIDNAFAWMEKELHRVVPEHVIQTAQGALTDPRVTPGGSLASVIDAVTMAALTKDDPYDQYDIERIAAGLLNKGLAEAVRSGGSIKV